MLFDNLQFMTLPRPPPRFDDVFDVISRAIGGLKVNIERIFSDQVVGRVAKDQAIEIDQSNSDLMRRQVRTVLGVEPVLAEPWLAPEVEQFVRENVSLIKTVPTEGLADIEQMLFRDARRRLSPQQMQARIVEQFELSEFKARRIAVDQVLKFNGNLTELRQRQIGVTRYIWRTARDQRVRGNPAGKYPNARPSHWALEGEEFKWDEPPESGTNGERLHPGQPILCRCYAEPVMDELLARQPQQQVTVVAR